MTAPSDDSPKHREQSYSELGRRHGKKGNPRDFEQLAMTVNEAGRLGGKPTRPTHGREFYEQIGESGGKRVRQLIEASGLRNEPPTSAFPSGAQANDPQARAEDKVGARRRIRRIKLLIRVGPRQIDRPGGQSSILAVLLLPLVLLRATARNPRLARWLVAQALRFIPIASREQKEAEWLGEIEYLEQQGHTTLGIALRILRGAPRTGGALRRNSGSLRVRTAATVHHVPAWLLGMLAFASAFLLAVGTLGDTPLPIKIGVIALGSAAAGAVVWLPAREQKRQKRR